MRKRISYLVVTLLLVVLAGYQVCVSSSYSNMETAMRENGEISYFDEVHCSHNVGMMDSHCAKNVADFIVIPYEQKMSGSISQGYSKNILNHFKFIQREPKISFSGSNIFKYNASFHSNLRSVILLI